MFPTCKVLLDNWNAAHSERAKLQHVYIAAGCIGIVLAGLVSLLDYNAGRTILRLAFMAAGMFLVNAIVWALLFSLVINKVQQPQNTRKPNRQNN